MLLIGTDFAAAQVGKITKGGSRDKERNAIDANVYSINNAARKPAEGATGFDYRCPAVAGLPIITSCVLTVTLTFRSPVIAVKAVSPLDAIAVGARSAEVAPIDTIIDKDAKRRTNFMVAPSVGCLRFLRLCLDLSREYRTTVGGIMMVVFMGPVIKKPERPNIRLAGLGVRRIEAGN